MKRAFRHWAWLCLVLLLVLTLGLLPARSQSTGASTSLLTSRINQLEANLSILRSQVTQLQSHLARIDNSFRPSAPPRESAPSPGDPSLDTQFDNLAILVIELRDRIITLETKVADLEASPRR